LHRQNIAKPKDWYAPTKFNFKLVRVSRKEGGTNEVSGREFSQKILGIKSRIVTYLKRIAQAQLQNNPIQTPNL
ncbi:MAG: hypothetical protein KJ592_01870, partial [Nanoarchaeota archaeon]|nr:hypothetical protein [Nanoarchaeota archaeon]